MFKRDASCFLLFCLISVRINAQVKAYKLEVHSMISSNKYILDMHYIML